MLSHIGATIENHVAIFVFNLTLEVSKNTWGGGGQSDLSPSTFDTIRPIDMKFGTYNTCKFHLYFQLSETKWYLIGFHCNDSQINDVTSGRRFGFLNFQILSNLNFCASK